MVLPSVRLVRFYLGAPEPTWIGRADYPLMVSVRIKKKWGRRESLAPWVLDSGGFTQLHLTGRYEMAPHEYLEKAYERHDRHKGLAWISPQDWMCEPSALEATGLSIEEHLNRTVSGYLELSDLDERDLVIPVLQGWEMDDYLSCFDLYLSAGVDLRAFPVVGVGSVCRRQNTDEIADIFKNLYDLGINMHGFGVKRAGLGKYQDYLVSADSMAWAYTARYKGRNLCGRTGHKRCEQCFYWASMWYTETTRNH